VERKGNRMELDLNAQQRAAFDQYIAAMRRPRRADAHRTTEPLMKARLGRARQAQPDEARARTLFDKEGDKRR